MIAYFQELLDILFPTACFACGAHLKEKQARILCQICQDSIVPNTAFICTVCRGRLPARLAEAPAKRVGKADAGISCLPAGRRCHKYADYVLFAYSSYSNPALRALIWQLKFRRRSSAAGELAGFLHSALLNLNFDAQKYVCVPIPLHPSRLRQRGFNQAELVANELSRNFAIPVIAAALVKTRKTKPQTETKDREERRKNLTGCFRVIKPEAIAGKNILLIDDVWTSGTTMNEAAYALKLAGAHRIIALVLAKAG